MYNEGTHSGEFLLSEGNGQISREEVTLAVTADDMPAGTILCADGGGKYVPFTSGAAEAVILYSPKVAAEIEQPATVIARDAEVVKSLLVGLTAESEAALASAGIIVR